ncbi:MAG: hypothetical protein Q4D29_09940 [Lachnospiraceae bacterium]|nr:hypothetical protein [Lachnospiraceae bacterium]
MNNNQIFKRIVITLNIIGIICLCYFSFEYITHNTYIANPDAMLPVEAWDAAGMCLTLGTIPLIIVNTLGYLFINLGSKWKRLLWFTPAAFCLIQVISYWI